MPLPARSTLYPVLVLSALMLLLAGAKSTRAQEHEKSQSTEHAEAGEHAETKGAAEAKEGGEEHEAPEPKTDFTLLVGSDFVRPGSLPRANLSIGIGHAFEFLKKDPLGDGVTFGYAYENTGTHGFFHTNFGEHSELLGQMRDFKLRHSKYAIYNWLQGGLSTLTGDEHAHNRFSFSETVGLKIHASRSFAIWIQESYNKVVTLPWYTITSIGYTYSR